MGKKEENGVQGHKSAKCNVQEKRERNIYRNRKRKKVKVKVKSTR